MSENWLVSVAKTAKSARASDAFTSQSGGLFVLKYVALRNRCDARPLSL